MNSLLVFDNEFLDSTQVELIGERAKRLADEQELALGTVVHLAHFGRERIIGVVRGLTEKSVRIEVRERCGVPTRMPVTLCVAVPRPQTIKKILSLGAQLGLKRIVFMKTHGTVRSYLQSRSLDRSQIETELHKGMEQVWDPFGPEVRICNSMKEFFAEPWFGDSLHSDCVKLLAHQSGEPMTRRLSAVSGRAIIAIGPESGWAPSERGAFSECGFQEVSLGERVVRVELAATALLAQFSLLRELRGANITAPPA